MLITILLYPLLIIRVQLYFLHLQSNIDWEKEKSRSASSPLLLHTFFPPLLLLQPDTLLGKEEVVKLGCVKTEGDEVTLDGREGGFFGRVGCENMLEGSRDTRGQRKTY